MDNLKTVTFIIPIIRSDLLKACLDSLYANTDSSMFYVYVIDQSIDGLDINLRDKYKNLMIIRTPKSDVHYTGNLGHSQATNLGISLVQTPYLCMLNDDVIFVHPGWWEGIMETFRDVEKATPERPALMVNAASIKLPDWSVGRPKGEDHYILPFKEKYTNEDWDFLVNQEHYVNEHLTIKPNTVIDGVNLYCSIVDTRRLLEVGLIDDFWYPGGANDYDLCARASMLGYRCVGTTKSWVFHHWSVSFQAMQDQAEVGALVQDELKHENLELKWGANFDIWGQKCSQCGANMRCLEDPTKAVCPKHPDEIFDIPENTLAPL